MRNTFAENGVELSLGKIGKYGILKFLMNQTVRPYKKPTEDQLKNKNYCIALGGDHSITYQL